MEKFLESLIKREEGIKDWLRKNNLESFLDMADQALNNLPKEAILKEFQEQIEVALSHCVENDEIVALDFEWFYSGQEIGGALAYGLDGCETEGNLSNTDLGPEELPGIELDFDHGDLVDEDFAEIPVYYAINLLVNQIKPALDSSTELGSWLGYTEQVLTDYFQIWNYKLAYKACELLKNGEEAQQLRDRGPFWVTMTRHERWPVPIMLIDK